MMETEVNKCFDGFVHNKMDSVLKRHVERKKLDKSGVLQSNLAEVDNFTELFNMKHKKIENELRMLLSMDPADQLRLSNEINIINAEIQGLQKLYSNAVVFLRRYDKKIFQESLQALQTKLQNMENQLMPKKKFGFKMKKNNVESLDIKFDENKMASNSESSDLSMQNFVGILGKSNEELVLEGDEIKARDVMLKDLKNCCIHMKGVPSTVHGANLENCKLYFGPVSTSVFLENVKNSSVHLACQQLRIHDTINTDFYIHVTCKAVIENCKSLRFGVYDFSYEGIDEDYEVSGLNRQINNWDQVDDFNWLITSKPSPNWSKINAN